MAKVKVSEATGLVLDYLVAVADSHRVALQSGHLYLVDERQRRICEWKPSVAWAQGGPIIGREQINLDQFKGHPCRAHLGTHIQYEHAMFAPEGQPLVAAMRCYVASKLGDEVEVPDELCRMI